MASAAGTVNREVALQFLHHMKDTFQDNTGKYVEFLQIMRDFMAKRIDTAGVVIRAKEILEGHSDLIEGFNKFLPEGYKIKLEVETASSCASKVKIDSKANIPDIHSSENKSTQKAYHKLIAEVLGTYFVIFAGCAVAVNLSKGSVTFPVICITWGLAVMVMTYSVGRISGAHFNPAVTLAYATCGRFPWKEVPAYAIAQFLGSTLASGTLRLMFGHEYFFGTVPAGSDIQALVLEFIISFYLMFVICGVATDNRTIGELAGLAVGSIVLVNVLYAGPITGASMNPARTLGPAIVMNRYKGLWLYFVGPICGTIVGAHTYNLIGFTNKPVRELTKRCPSSK